MLKGRTAHKGTSPSVGSRPIELEMESDFEKPHMAGIWTIRATFMEDGKSLGIYEKKFAVVSNTVLPHELLGMSEVYKVKGICSTDAGAGADRGGGQRVVMHAKRLTSATHRAGVHSLNAQN